MKVLVDGYRINDLPEAVQSKLRDQAREDIVDGNFEVFREVINDTIKEELGIDAVASYSLTYSQGDGFYFNTDDFLSRTIEAKIRKVLDERHSAKGDLYEAVNEVFVWACDNKHYRIRIHKVFNCGYSYPSKRDVDCSELFEALEDENEDFIKALNGITIDQVEEEFLNTITRVYLDICKYYESVGYRCYDVDDEEIENLLSDDIYLKDGTFLGTAEQLEVR